MKKYWVGLKGPLCILSASQVFLIKDKVIFGNMFNAEFNIGLELDFDLDSRVYFKAILNTYVHAVEYRY